MYGGNKMVKKQKWMRKKNRIFKGSRPKKTRPKPRRMKISGKYSLGNRMKKK